jgi:hypothetical protein
MKRSTRPIDRPFRQRLNRPSSTDFDEAFARLNVVPARPAGAPPPAMAMACERIRWAWPGHPVRDGQMASQSGPEMLTASFVPGD